MYSIADTLSSRIALGVCWLTRRCRVRVKRPSASAVVVRIYSIATVDAHAKPMWHHKSVIALFHIVLRLLIDLIALTALALRQRRPRTPKYWSCGVELPSTKSGESSRGELTR